MPNPKIADLISEALRNGLLHPGDPEKDIPPKPIVLPLGAKPGMPKEMGDLMDGTVKLLGEAIVHLIESKGDSEIVPRGEIKTLRYAAGEVAAGTRLVPLHCHCDPQTPLAILTVTDPDRIVIDGSAFIGELVQRKTAHPHERNV